MAGRFELLLGENREQRPGETEFVAVGVNQVEEALSHSASRGSVVGWYHRARGTPLSDAPDPMICGAPI
jgi:hypothetical protein